MLCPPELLKAQGGGFGKNGIIKIYQKGIFCKLQHDSNVRLLTGSLTLTDFAEAFVAGVPSTRISSLLGFGRFTDGRRGLQHLISASQALVKVHTP